MVDAVVTVFLERLFDALVDQSHVLSSHREQFEKLQIELQLMQSFLKDAERLKRKNEFLKSIMHNLWELIYEAEDILADCQGQSTSSTDKFLNGYSTCYQPNKVTQKYQTGKRLREINERITSIKAQMSSFPVLQLIFQQGMTKFDEDALPRWSSPVYDHTQVVGLEDDTRKIKDWLSQASRGILAVGIVGMGGLGKTTLAQKVFNHKETELCFEKKIWVSVSEAFTEGQIMRCILRNLGDTSTGDNGGELLKKINLYLQGKRFLIVMDDVWSKDNTWWLRILDGLPKGNGSCVIVTTRIEEVARKMGVQTERIHRPKFLSKDDAWLLFCNIAFAAHESRCVYSELENIGREIIDKCGGLPLAIKAVGGMMLCKPPQYHEWKRISDHFRDELAEDDDFVMASLRLSYDELPSYLKSCFLSLSIYPEDYIISKDQLIHWWIGERFVPLRSGRLSTEASEDCLSGLTNRCLVEVVDRDYNGRICTCKVHDMVRDLVIKIAADYSFSGDTKIVISRHLGLKSDTDETQLTRSCKLRALISTVKTGEVNKICSTVARKFCEFRYLQVLDLSKSIFQEPLAILLDKISSLKHLTCLNLSNTHPLIQVPSSAERLRNLQIFDVSYCQNLKSLPPFIMTFKKLTMLDVSHCGSLEFLPKGLGLLLNLEVLLGFRPARMHQFEGSRIRELRSLTRLRMLGLQITCADEIDDFELDTLAGLRSLQILTLSCFNSLGNDHMYKLEKLIPPSQLYELSLKFYTGKTSPKWLNPISLPMLRFLCISAGNLAKMDQSFWGDDQFAWKIEGLKLESLSDLSESWSMVHQVMPSLRTVYACWCPELRSFPIENVGFRGGMWKKEES